MAPDDPLTFWTPEQLEAAAAEFLENLAPPPWFYPMVGEVASKTVLLEYYMTEVALALTGNKADPREMIKSSGQMEQVLKDAKGKNKRFDALIDEFQPARYGRNAIVHAVLWWHDGDEDYGDYWEHHHPRSIQRTLLGADRPPEWIVALERIRDLTQRAYELSKAISPS